MSRYSIILRGMVVAALLALGTQQGYADPDVDGMDHSKLNHGVLGHAARQDIHDGHQPANNDPDVTGMDHSKLNHGVLGTAGGSPTR